LGGFLFDVSELRTREIGRFFELDLLRKSNTCYFCSKLSDFILAAEIDLIRKIQFLV
jgi:hypothetical protein